MNKFDELVNDYTLMGDDGAVIFASYDHVLEFVEKIRADEREACAQLVEMESHFFATGGAAMRLAEEIRARGEK